MSETVMTITYGLELKPEHDPHIEAAEKAVEALANVPYAGAFMVDIFPSLKYVPSWMPGAGFKRKAKGWKALALDSLNKPFNTLRAEMVCIHEFLVLRYFIILLFDLEKGVGQAILCVNLFAARHPRGRAVYGRKHQTRCWHHVPRYALFLAVIYK